MTPGFFYGRNALSITKSNFTPDAQKKALSVKTFRALKKR